MASSNLKPAPIVNDGAGALKMQVRHSLISGFYATRTPARDTMNS